MQLSDDAKTKKAISFALLTIATIIYIKTAWINDDAYITLRTVLNFINGFGPTFNIDERVQAFTHPLWFLLLSATSFLAGNVFYTTFSLSITASLVTLWLVLSKVSNYSMVGVFALITLLLSKAFVDFSTSGLENPLSHLLIVLIILTGVKVFETHEKVVNFSNLTYFFGTCALLYLNRPDLILLILPVASLAILKHRKQPVSLAKSIAIAALPVILWTFFATYYYGFPFPNTAYAKLGTGIPLDERMTQGVRYLFDSLDRDPLTLAVITVGIFLGMQSKLFDKSLAVGCLLYLFYIIYIGGDFMSGRFLTSPLLISTILIIRANLSKQALGIVMATFALLSINTIHATLLSNSSYNNRAIPASGIADERGYYAKSSGLISANKTRFQSIKWVEHEDKNKRVAVVCGGLGTVGISGGPSLHVIDYCALADPLLARLPAAYNPDWRIGHFARNIPENYIESIRKNQNTLDHPEFRKVYDSLRLITRGPLNDIERIKEIVRFNLGFVKLTSATYSSKQAEVKKHSTISSEALKTEHAELQWDTPGNVIFDKTIVVSLPAPIHINKLSLSLDHNDIYLLEYWYAGAYHRIGTVGPGHSQNGMALYHPEIKETLPATNKFRITAIRGDGKYSLGIFNVN